MTNRERFRRIMRYEAVDRLPVLALEPFEKTAIEHWHNEGLPPNAGPVEFLGMAKLEYTGGVGLGPNPGFGTKVLSEDDEYIVETTEMGATVRRSKVAPSTFYGHIDHPIKTPADWEQYKKRMDPDSSERAEYVLAPERLRHLTESDNPVGLCFFPFFFRLGFYTMGMERFLTAFYDYPEMMHDMFAHSSRLIRNSLGPILENLTLDFALFNEDLAGKNGPLISPRIYEEFWYPYQDPIVRMLRDAGVPVICQWSAGEFDVLLPGMMEHGFNCTWPLEKVAGMDGPGLRRRYGPGLLLGGNIAKEAVIAGPEAIDREIERLMPLIREGGFIPAMDDMAPMECPFAHYQHLIARLQEIRLG